MKKTLLLVFVIAISFSMGCVNFTDTTPDVPKELEGMVWNCWHKNIRPAEEKEIINIIKASDVDVVLMIETYGIAKRLATATDMDFVIMSQNPEAEGENLSIFFKKDYKLLKKEHHLFSSFRFISCVIDVAGTPVRLGDVWIDYRPDASAVPTDKTEAEILAWERNDGSRVKEMKTILNLLKQGIKQSNDIPLIVGGDFNANSHLDWTESTANMPEYRHNGKVVNWEISNLMYNAGFIDSFRAIHPNPALNYGVSWLIGEDNTTGQDCRIDYLYYQGAKIRPLESQYYNHPLQTPGFEFKGEEFTFPSDHGFVITKFLINGK